MLNRNNAIIQRSENLANADKGYLIWKTTDSNTVKVYWDDNSNREYLPDGYRIRIYSVDGKKLLKTYNADRYYHLYVFKGANALVSDLEIENNDFSKWKPDFSFSITECENVGGNDVEKIEIQNNTNKYFYEN